MNLLNSLRAAGQVLRTDLRLCGLGTTPGWYTWTHYRGRLASRRGEMGGQTSTALRIGNWKPTIHMTPQHLGAFLGIFLDQEYNIERFFKKECLTRVVDLGANVGMGTLALSNQFSNARFACVEPDPRNHWMLEKTFQDNNVDGTILKCAAASNPGRLNLRFGDNPTCSALESSPMHCLTETVEVEVKTMPQIMAEMKWDRVDLLKIDIEGSEDDLLQHNNDWLAQVGAIVMEIHPNTTAEKIQSYLQPFHLKLQRIGFDREPVYFAART